MDESLEQQLLQRFSLATFLESVRLYEEKMASIEDIDVAMRAGAGLATGPFQWADTRGLDTVLAELTELENSVGERFRPPESLKTLVAQGDLGVKTGRGYLQYSASEE